MDILSAAAKYGVVKASRDNAVCQMQALGDPPPLLDQDVGADIVTKGYLAIEDFGKHGSYYRQLVKALTGIDESSNTNAVVVNAFATMKLHRETVASGILSSMKLMVGPVLEDANKALTETAERQQTVASALVTMATSLPDPSRVTTMGLHVFSLEKFPK